MSACPFAKRRHNQLTKTFSHYTQEQHRCLKHKQFIWLYTEHNSYFKVTTITQFNVVI